MVTIFIITMVMKAINLAQHKKTPMGIAAMQNFLEVGNKKAKGDFMILNVSVTKGLTVQLI